MTLWFVLALMTAGAIFAVLWPLGRRAPLRGGSDVAVYRDQLDEIERDRSTGVIGEREAEAARVEVSRRLIAAADAATGGAASAAPTARETRRRRVTALVALLLLPIMASGLYTMLGAPQLPGQPHTERSTAPPEQRSVTELVARVEEHLENNPDDGRGWEVIAPVYARLGRYDDAVKARRNALRLLGESAAREADLGEALTGLANGVVTDEAKAAFDRAIRHDANEFKARYYLGLAAEQDGWRAEAAAAWRALLAQAPPGAAWVELVQESLRRVDPAAVVPGPSAEEIVAAAELPPEQRAAMVKGMVERVAARLQSDGSDVDGWLRLVRAYAVMGEADKARAAAGDARRALAREPDKLRRVDDLIKGLGLEG